MRPQSCRVWRGGQPRSSSGNRLMLSLLPINREQNPIIFSVNTSQWCHISVVAHWHQGKRPQRPVLREEGARESPSARAVTSPPTYVRSGSDPGGGAQGGRATPLCPLRQAFLSLLSLPFPSLSFPFLPYTFLCFPSFHFPFLPFPCLVFSSLLFPSFSFPSIPLSTCSLPLRYIHT